MKNSRVIIFIFMILFLILLVSCNYNAVDNELTDKNNSEVDLENRIRDLEVQLSILENDNENLRDDNSRLNKEIVSKQQEVDKIREASSFNGMLEYNYNMVESELNRSWREIELLRDNLNQYKGNQDTTSSDIYNMYNPYTIKKGETYAGLTVEEVSKYEGEFLSYTIKFNGEFQVTGKLEYSEVEDTGYFLYVIDGLDNIPYQVKNLTYPINFFIGEPEELTNKGIKEGDIITATFTDYIVQFIPGKPTVDSAKLVKLTSYGR